MRGLIARALLASLRGYDGGKLLLVGDSAFPIAARHDVFGLAGALTDMLSGTALTIHVQFCDEPDVEPAPLAARPLAYTAGTSARRIRVASAR
jgi:hypothetical protein